MLHAPLCRAGGHPACACGGWLSEEGRELVGGMGLCLKRSADVCLVRAANCQPPQSFLLTVLFFSAATGSTSV